MDLKKIIFCIFFRISFQRSSHIIYISMLYNRYMSHNVIFNRYIFSKNTHNLIILKLISFINSRIVNIEINVK